MDRGNRSELLKTIESQQEKIHKYENKLRDLVMAYKSVIKEKEALEAIVKALSSASSTPATTPKVNRTQSRQGEEGDEATEEEKEEEAEPNDTDGDGARGDQDPADSEVSQLQAQLATLTNSLMTLSEEKSKLEANFVADKRKIRQELEAKNIELETEKKRGDEIIQQMTQDLQEWKNKLRNQQREREKEHSDHAMMLRELQKLLGDERASKEVLENQIDDLKQELQDRSRSSSFNNDQHEKVINDLIQEHEALRKQIKAAEEKAAEPSSAFLELQQELEDLKTEHQLSLHREQIRSIEVENMVKSNTRDTEHRASSLEAKMSELSEVVGNYERLRYQDEQTMAKLRERISQLDLENTALAQATSRKTGLDQVFSGLEGSTDIHEVLEKMIKLKEILKIVNENSERPVNLDEVLQDSLGFIDPDQVHSQCREEYNIIKEEFERYKLRAQSVLKSKSSKDPSPRIEVENLNGQITELKDRLFHLRSDYEDQSLTLKTKEETFRNSIISLTEKHSDELSSQAADFKHRAGEQELEIRRHRERTIALLAEKDRELEKLRLRLPDHLESQYITSYRQMSHGSDPGAGEIGASSEEGTAVSELLSRTSVHPGSPGESTLLHFAQEQARKEVEIQNLRKHKHGLEMAMRELQQSSILKEQRYVEQIDLLKEEIRKYERNVSRESANLEYLKNVVYHFMVCTDKMGKQGTLNAISLILQFSPKEKFRVQKELDRGWWYYANSEEGRKTQV